jgi:hypothetical protein
MRHYITSSPHKNPHTQTLGERSNAGNKQAKIRAARTGWLQDRHNWPDLKDVLMVESQREYNDKVERETRFYITSSTLDAQTLGPMI